MRTIRLLQDNSGAIWKEGDIVKITLNGVHNGTHLAKLVVIGVNMITIQIIGEGEEEKDIQLVDLGVVLGIERG